MSVTFTPIKNETVVVLRDGRVIGTIKRYRAHRRCLVSVPGVLSPAANPGEANFATIAEAKAAILEKLADDDDAERLAA